MKLKLIALLLAVCMIFSCLTACGESKQTEEPAAPAETSAPEESAAPTEETSAGEEAPEMPDWDFAAAYAKHDPDAVVYTVNGAEVVWSEYFAWLYSVIGQIATYYGITDWDTELDEGYTCQDYIREYAEGMSCEYALVARKAADLGISLTKEDLAAVDALIQADADAYYDGDVNALFDYLKTSYYTEEYYRFMTGSAMLYEKIFEHYFGENGSKLSDEDALNWVKDNNYIYAKHILIKCIDDEGKPLEDSALEEKVELAADLVKQLQACPDDEREALFDKLMHEYSEDTGLAVNPDGYYFQTGQMVPNFEYAATTLEKNTVQGVVESEYGLHILYQNGMSADHVFTCDTYGNPITVRFQAANALFSEITAEWTEEMEIVYTPEFETIDLDELFGVL